MDLSLRNASAALPVAIWVLFLPCNRVFRSRQTRHITTSFDGCGGKRWSTSRPAGTYATRLDRSINLPSALWGESAVPCRTTILYPQAEEHMTSAVGQLNCSDVMFQKVYDVVETSIVLYIILTRH